MKILYCFIAIPTEGSRIHIESFIRAFESTGSEIVVAGRYLPPHKSDKASWNLGRRIRTRLQWFGINIAEAVRVVRMIGAHRPDVVLIRLNALHLLLGSIVVASLFRPVVLEVNAVRSIEEVGTRPWISDWLDRLCMFCSRKIMVVSVALKEYLIRYYGTDPEKIAVIANGVDVEQFSPVADKESLRERLGLDGKYVVGFVGSFRRWHAIDEIIDTAGLLVKELPDVRFLLVGDGPDRGRYEGKVRDRGLAGYFSFVGHVKHADVASYLGVMDVVMAPMLSASFATGFYGSPLKVFEYMAMGKPVIAPPMGQLTELIEHGVSGYLVPSEDTRQISRTLLDLYLDPERRRHIGMNARSVVTSRYTWRKNAEDVNSLCVSAKSRSAGQTGV